MYNITSKFFCILKGARYQLIELVASTDSKTYAATKIASELWQQRQKNARLMAELSIKMGTASEMSGGFCDQNGAFELKIPEIGLI